ncbi:MAG: hypothetical protein M3264_02770 [Thermoproteota archaeon]|nr:hypothetical protein [Thermoproteota archaeon]
MISQLSSVLLRCHQCGGIAAASPSSFSQEVADAGFVTIRVFNNRDKDKDGELESIYSSSLRFPCFHHMRETLIDYGEVSNNIFTHHKCSSSSSSRGIRRK